MCLVHLDGPKMGPTSMELTKFYLKLELRRALLYIYIYIYVNRGARKHAGFLFYFFEKKNVSTYGGSL